jgi:hypothetical protein
MFNCSFAAVCADPISLLVFFLLTLVNSNFAKIVNVSTQEKYHFGHNFAAGPCRFSLQPQMLQLQSVGKTELWILSPIKWLIPTMDLEQMP